MDTTLFTLIIIVTGLQNSSPAIATVPGFHAMPDCIAAAKVVEARGDRLGPTVTTKCIAVK
jgi:hypothetical protein